MSTWQADVARARWRADLLEYSADLLRSVGMDADAAAKDLKAARGRKFADLVEQFEEARATMERRDGDENELPLYAALRDRFADARRELREASGRHVDDTWTIEVQTVDNFAEPTDDELLEATS